MTDTTALYKPVSLIFSHERPEIAQFRTDLPAILEALRGKINDAYAGNTAFRDVADKFLAHAKLTTPDPDRSRHSGNADPAHPDRGNLQ